jgi:hypothetical protein
MTKAYFPVSSFSFILRPSADHSEFDAQVPAPLSPGQGQRHPAAALLHLQDVRLQGDLLRGRHGIPK